MKKLLTVLLVALVVGSFMTGEVMAQAQQGRQAQQGQLQNMFRLSQLKDMNVKTQQGQDIGSVEDIVIDKQGQNAYLILSGDKLGKENQLIPVPVRAANPQIQQNNLVISVSQQQLRDAPGFQEDNWAQFSQIQQRVNTYYGAQPGAQPGQMKQNQQKQTK
jgi:sporulation protein YlmC with PRC-barrel domain